MHSSYLREQQSVPSQPRYKNKQSFSDMLFTFKKNKNERQNYQNFISQTYNLSNILANIVRKMLRDSWKTIKSKTEERKWEQKVRQKARDEHDFSRERQRSKTPELQRKNTRAQLLSQMLDNLQKKKHELLYIKRQKQPTLKEKLKAVKIPQNQLHHCLSEKELQKVKQYKRQYELTVSPPPSERKKSTKQKFEKKYVYQQKEPTYSPIHRGRSKIQFHYLSPSISATRVTSPRSVISSTSEDYRLSSNSSYMKGTDMGSVIVTEENMNSDTLNNSRQKIYGSQNMKEKAKKTEKPEKKKKINVVSEVELTRRGRIYLGERLKLCKKE